MDVWSISIFLIQNHSLDMTQSRSSSSAYKSANKWFIIVSTCFSNSSSEAKATFFRIVGYFLESMEKLITTFEIAEQQLRSQVDVVVVSKKAELCNVVFCRKGTEILSKKLALKEATCGKQYNNFNHVFYSLYKISSKVFS